MPVVGRGREMLRGDPRDGDQLMPDRLGRATHEVICELAAERHRDRARVADAVSRALTRRGTANPALRRRLTNLAHIYLNGLVPPGEVALVGHELTVGEVRMDLVWATDGRVWADELKTTGGRMTPPLAAQCARQLRAGTARWGSAFAGVRVVWLGCGRTLLVGPSDSGAPGR